MILNRRQAITSLAVLGGTAALKNDLLFASPPIPSLVVEPEDFGQVADSRGDAAAAINAAIGELVSRGGGTLRFRSGKTYRLETTDPRTGATHADFLASIGLPGGARDIVIDLNGAVLLQVADAYSIGSAFAFFNSPQLARTALPMRGTPGRGDTSLELAPGVPVPRPGSVVMLSAGNTDPQAFVPVGEMQVVSGVSGRTLHFDRPLAKSYHPFGRASFGAPPFGVFDISQNYLRNISLTGPGRIVNYKRRAGNLMQVLGLTMSNVTCEGRGGMGMRGRDLQVLDCTANIQANWRSPMYRPYCLAFDTGTSHAVVRNFRANGGSNVTYLHLHEAVADVQVRGLSILNGTTFDPRGENPAAISILGSSWNVLIDGASVTNNPQGPAIRALQSALGAGGNRNLQLRDITIAGEFRSQPVTVTDDAAVSLDDIDVSRAHFPGSPRSGGKIIVKGDGVKLGRVIDAQ